MKKLFIKNKILPILALSFLIFFFVPDKSIKGEEELEGMGCCEIIQSGNIGVGGTMSLGGKTYQNTTEEQCYNYISDTKNVNFYINKKVGIDNKSCVDRTTVEEEKRKIEPTRDPILPQLQVSIPGFGKFSEIKCDEDNQKCEIPWIAEYIGALYKYSLTIITLLAVVVIMLGGVVRLTAAGNRSQIGQGNSLIKSGTVGAILAFCSYLILFLINPNLTILKPISVNYITKVDIEEFLPPEDLVSEYTDPSLPTENLGTGKGQYNIPILYQGRFQSLDMGMGKCGCGPTSLAMVLNYHGVKVTAPEIARTAKNNGSWQGGTNTSCGGWRGGMPGFSKIASQYNLKHKTGGSFNDAINLLQHGPVIASVTGNGKCRCAFTGGAHYIVITGHSNGVLYTNDPNEGNLKRGTDKIQMSEVNKCCKINAGVIAIYK
ncbi:MAG: C39 family peptidase [Patescibacteria group bacterium]|nr:MAG: C39 family peptidase [Patescibacteria group bacterium]